MTRPKAAPVLLLALVLATATALAGCGSDSGSDKKSASSSSYEKSVKVTGDVGKKPTIKIDAPLKVSKAGSFEPVKGDGKTLPDGKTYLIQVTLADAKSGKTVISTYDPGQAALAGKKGDNSIFPGLVDALAGKKVGSRVAWVAPAKDAYGDQGNAQLGVKAGDPVVVVADLIAVEPTDVLKGPDGKKLPAASSSKYPKVMESGGKVTGIDFHNLPKVKKLTVVPLIQGTGPVVKNPDLVAFNYFGAVWGQKKPFDESYTKGSPPPFGVGVNGLIPAWDKTIPGVKQGTRLLILTPPDQAYGPKGSPPAIPKNATLAFVVDVLGVS